MPTKVAGHIKHKAKLDFKVACTVVCVGVFKSHL